jgi:hypothetical protein
MVQINDTARETKINIHAGRERERERESLADQH